MEGWGWGSELGGYRGSVRWISLGGGGHSQVAVIAQGGVSKGNICKSDLAADCIEKSVSHAVSMARDAEMTIKIIFERSSQKGGRQGVRKEGQHGTHLEILLSG